MAARVPGILLALLVSIAPKTEATIIFDNLGPGDTYNCCTGWTMGSAFVFDQGEAFTPLSSGPNFTLDSIELAVGLLDGPNALDVFLMTDAGGVPDGILETFHFSNSMDDFGNLPLNPLLFASSLTHPLLVAGNQYWLIASAPAEILAAWSLNSIGDVGPHACSASFPPVNCAMKPAWDVSAGPRGAFRISGTAVGAPEPSSTLVFTAGIVGLAALRRCRSRRG